MESPFLVLSVALVSASLRIHDIQGVGHRSPLVDRDVTEVEGVVTQLGPHGFFLQDLEPDGDLATSEGIRVSSDAPVTVGDVVRLSGVVREVRPGCASCSATNEAFANLTITQIAASEVTPMGHASELPAAVRMGEGPGERLPPTEIVHGEGVGDVETGGAGFDPTRRGLDFYESLEGMRVEVDHARAVGPTVQLAGRGAEVAVVANDGRGAGPFTSRGGLRRRAGDDNPERIFVTGGRGAAVPALDVGDAWTDPVVGVIDYAFGHYELLADHVPLGLGLAPPKVTPAMPPGETDELTVASFNVKNLSPASPADRFESIAEILVRDLGAPDVVVLQEIQDNSGPVDDGSTDASATYEALVEAIATRGGPRYSFRDVAPDDAMDGGAPGGNIRVGFLVRSESRVALVDRSGWGANAVRDVGGVPRLALSPGRIAPDDPAFLQSRKPVAIELRFGDEPLFVIGVHFNSQIGDQPLFGRFQPPDRPTRAQRTSQARAVADFVREILAIDPRARVLVAGDMNDDEASPPLAALYEAGLGSLCLRLPESERYTYVFQGNAEVVDHVLASDALVERLVDLRIAHANADFARAPSDHDPVVARISLREGAPVAAGCRCELSRMKCAGQPTWPLVLISWLARRGQKRAQRPPRRFLWDLSFSGKDRRP